MYNSSNLSGQSGSSRTRSFGSASSPARRRSISSGGSASYGSSPRRRSTCCPPISATGRSLSPQRSLSPRRISSPQRSLSPQRLSSPRRIPSRATPMQARPISPRFGSLGSLRAPRRFTSPQRSASPGRFGSQSACCPGSSPSKFRPQQKFASPRRGSFGRSSPIRSPVRQASPIRSPVRQGSKYAIVAYTDERKESSIRILSVFNTIHEGMQALQKYGQITDFRSHPMYNEPFFRIPYAYISLDNKVVAIVADEEGGRFEPSERLGELVVLVEISDDDANYLVPRFTEADVNASFASRRSGSSSLSSQRSASSSLTSQTSAPLYTIDDVNASFAAQNLGVRRGDEYPRSPGRGSLSSSPRSSLLQPCPQCAGPLTSRVVSGRRPDEAASIIHHCPGCNISRWSL